MYIYNTAATDIVLTLIVLVIITVLSYFLVKAIKKNILIEKEQKATKIDGVITRTEMNSLISTYINRTNGESPFSLIYIDLDKFEDFSIAFGQKETKNIIRQVAQKIKKFLPKNTYIARYKGDDFLIFLPSTYNRADCLVIAEDILEDFQEKFSIYDDVEIDLTASIAIAQYPNHGSNINNLIQALQLTIHRIKKDGGNDVKVYYQSLTNEEEEMNYYYQIKKAIREKEFMLYYQPIINTTDNSIYAYEALLRWDHPELGVLAPNKFINIMEQTGDIHWVGQWGFEVLVKKYLELKLNNENTPLLSINLSPRQLMNEKISEDFYKILKRYKVDASNFILEIGDFMMFEKQPIVLENLVKLKKLNFKLAIDGFGIDIASFDKLEEFKIDIVKIDYKFIEEDSFAVNKYMEVFGEYINKTNKKIICQGIEEEKSENRAKSFKIDIMQGFFYSKPLNTKKIDSFVYKNVDIM